MISVSLAEVYCFISSLSNGATRFSAVMSKGHDEIEGTS